MMSGQGMSDPIATDNWRAFDRAVQAGHTDYIRIAKKCDRYYRGGGEQWDDDDRAKLEADGRPALEINMVLTTVNAMLGQHSAQRADFMFKPRRNAVAETAAVLTQLFDQILDNNKFQFKEREVFLDGIVEDRGYFDTRIDFTDNMMGEIRIMTRDPKSVVLDPEAKEYDPATWNEVSITEWLTPDEIETMYGKKARDSVENIALSGGTLGQDSIRYEDLPTYGDDLSRFVAMDSDRPIRSVRIVDRQHRVLTMQRFFVDNEHGDMRAVPDHFDDAKISQIVQQADISVVKRVVFRVRWTVSADGVLLHDDWSPYKRFTITPFFPYFRRGKPFGVVRNLLSPQEQLNKLSSQELHIVNTTANSGWIVEAGSLTNMTTDELEERGAETGLVLVYGKGKNEPKKISANNIPTGIDRMVGNSQNNIRTISGVGEGMLDIRSPEVSGVALEQKLNRGLVQLQVPFESLAYTRQLLAEHILELIQDFYTETRVLQVTNYEDVDKEVQEITINGMTPEGRVINDLTLGEYSVVVASAPARDTFLDSQFAEALALRNAGVQIPDDVVIENSNLANKAAIGKRVREMQGMGELSEQQIQMQELQYQVSMQTMQLSVFKLEAEVGKLEAEARLAAAKAGATEEEANVAAQKVGAEMRMTVEKMKQDWAKHITNLESKMQLANVHTQAKERSSVFDATNKRALEEIKQRGQSLKQASKESQQ